MDTELHFFKIQQRELIRKRQSEYWRKFELRKNAKAKVSSAPNTGGPITDQALNPAVPSTIKTLWEEVETLYDRHQIGPPLCPHHECPYCTGALMEQRFDLMQRLVTLEKLIWLGDRVKR